MTYIFLSLFLLFTPLVGQELAPNSQNEEVPLPEGFRREGGALQEERESRFELPEELRGADEAQSSRFFEEFIHMLILLGLLLLVLFAGSWIIRRMLNVRLDQVNVTSKIKLLEKRMITARTGIYLLDVHGKKIILSESNNGITKIAELDENPLSDS
ncbi:MAG: flagellar biosynthetic protein FliO [Waddliaceae bacterium]